MPYGNPFGNTIDPGELADGAVTAAKLSAGFYSPDATVVVKQGATDAENGTAFEAAYAAATQLTPGGNALSSTNRAAVIIPPGQYNLADFALDAEFVDLIAMFPQPGKLPTGWSPGDDLAAGDWQGHSTTFYGASEEFSGVLVQQADDVRMLGFAINNTRSQLGLQDAHGLSIEATNNAPSLYIDMTFWHTGSAGKDSGGVQSDGHFDGTWIRCVNGGGGGFRPHIASETAEMRASMFDCVAGTYSYGGDGNGAGSVGALFVRCLGGGQCFMACGANGTPIDADTLCIDCEAGDDSYGIGVLVEGTFIRCRGKQACFGATVGGIGQEGIFAGYAEDCTAGQGSFGGRGSWTGGSASDDVGEMRGEVVRCISTDNELTRRCRGATIRSCILQTATDDVDGIVLLDDDTTITDSTITVVQDGMGIPINDDGNARTVSVSHCRLNNVTYDTYELRIPLSSLVQHDAVKDALPDSADGSHMRLSDAVTSTANTTGVTDASTTEKLAALAVLPDFYVPQQDLTVRLNAQVSDSPETSASLDLEAKLLNIDGLGATDLCLTDAQDMTPVTSFADQDFTIDGDASGEELNAGSVLYLVATFAVDDTGGALITIWGQIAGVSLLIPYVGPNTGLGPNVTNLIHQPANVVDSGIV